MPNFIPDVYWVAVCVSCLLMSAAAQFASSQYTDLEHFMVAFQKSHPLPYSQYQLYKNEIPQDVLRAIEDMDERDEYKTENKRALSILTRWRSLGGRRMNSLNKTPRAPMSLMQGDYEGGKKDMPGRRVGGPLRWGKRRRR